jgi:hypothetical protein
MTASKIRGDNRDNDSWDEGKVRVCVRARRKVMEEKKPGEKETKRMSEMRLTKT